MSASEHPNPASLTALVTALRDRALGAQTPTALAFSIANDPYALLRFRQALVLVPRGTRIEVRCVSGLATPKEDSPYLNWLTRAGRWLDKELGDDSARYLSREHLAGQASSDPSPSSSSPSPPQPPPSPESTPTGDAHSIDDIADGWAEWWPDGAWCVPLHDREDKRLAIVVFLLDSPPPPALREQMPGLARTWSYCWQALSPRRRRHRLPGRKLVWVALVLAALALLIPVRQSALAPAQIVSRDAMLITSPLDGVIAEMLVRPHQPVAAGAPLFRLDTTSLEGRAAVLRQQLAVAEAELDAAGSLAFDDATSLTEMTRLQGQRNQQRAELGAVQAELERTLVRAPRDGVAVYRDPDDWQGRPVATGERILRLADPSRPAMEIQLAVADAIALDPGAEVTLFLSAYPLTPIDGVIEQTSYQARPDDNGIAAYRLLASVDGSPEDARLGLHGTAKLYGDEVSLGYYLLRRPLSALRAFTGW